MSHYTVAVITDDPNKLSDIMEPFYEGKEVAPYVKYTVEQLNTEFEEFKKKVHADMDLEPGDDDKLKRKKEYAKDVVTQTKDFDNNTWTARQFAEWYHGYEASDFDESGNALSTYNPQSKWDWYDIGGRWGGLLMLKNGKRVDKAKIKDVYFHGYSEAPVAADPVAAVRDEDPITKWIDENTKELSDHWDEVAGGKSFYNPEYYTEKYGTKEAYIEQSLKFTTYAVITADKKWMAPGTMGWFGCSSESAEDSNAFAKNYYDNFINTANPEHYIIVVDCHI